jgi:hypothetical protein
MSKPLFVCVACAQDFTRESDAKRHNSNHHLSKAKILSFLEYLIGRTNGTLPPPSQTPPRLSAKNKKMMLDRKDSDEQKMLKIGLFFYKMQLLLQLLMILLEHHQSILKKIS